MTADMIDLDLPDSAADSRASTRVVVAMSGGVDSSVVAALLKQAGYDVVGITLQLYDHGEATRRTGACCAGQDIHDARRVAQAIGIPHYVLDYERRFASSVIDAFAESYAAGETPIPCVACNQTVKFRDLLDTARDLGAAALATGHYISSRSVVDAAGATSRQLFRAADADRDQSYFLFATTPEQLDFLRFPLGDMPKDEVRAHARRLGLAIADKPDSQDICFVPSGRYSQVIERLRPDAASPGEIVHIDGRVLGRHDGIIHFTVGQRRGLGIAAGEPLFVVRLDAGKRQVIVGPREALAIDTIILRDLNWLGDRPLAELAGVSHPGGVPVHARIRSSQPPAPARLVVNGGQVAVILDDGEYGVSPGQACVLYSDGSARARVLGGGWIAGTANSALNRLGVSAAAPTNADAALRATAPGA